MTQATYSISKPERLLKACETMQLAISENQMATLLHYVEQLNRWNRTYNLTAIRDPELMLTQHIFDSLSVVKPLQQFLSQTQTETKAVMDVGSGAGLPGVVIAALCPDISVECVDAVEKKTTFIKQMAGVLGLPNLIATHARVETIPNRNYPAIISRAFASLTDFVTVAGQHASPKGALLAMKGQQPTEELTQLHQNTAWQATRIDPLHVPELTAHRCMIWLTRSNPT